MYSIMYYYRSINGYLDYLEYSLVFIFWILFIEKESSVSIGKTKSPFQVLPEHHAA